MKERTRLTILGLVVLVFLIVCSVTAFGDKVINYFRGNETVEQTTTIDTANTVEQFTIHDVLDMREQEREYRYLDSVYMNMPEIPLVAILLWHGTDMSHTDIAKEYLTNKKNYDNVEFGAQIREIYEQQKEVDSSKVPKSDVNEISKDSIPSHEQFSPMEKLSI